MKTKDMIAELQRLDPTGDMEIVVPVKSYSQVYPHDYLKPFGIEKAHDLMIRIYVQFGEGYIVSKRRKTK